MTRFGKWMLSAGLLAGISTFAAEDVDDQSTATNAVAAADLWAGMHAQGMIDDEQYQHVLANGCLPGGTVLTNSPIAAEAQADWNKLAAEEVISADELAAMLFDGDIPGLTEEEEKAFVELAPVYQPKRTKRLTYDVRRKHARVELIRLAHRLCAKQEALEERAKLLDIPLVLGNGVLIHIDEEGRPSYSESSGMNACDTISTDEVWPTNALGQACNTNFNLTGAGITLAMWEEGGVNQNHQEFAGRIVDLAGGSIFHANAVAAIMVGAGVEAGAHGMAPAATLHVYDRTGGHLTELAEVATNSSIRFSNHSYQTYIDDEYGAYTPDDKQRDSIVYTGYWHLPVWAVGNHRDDESYDYDTLDAGNAKNVLGVGAIEEITNGYTGASSVVMTDYSGWGPTDDERIKPDLVASGFSGLIPSTSGSSGYETKVGNGTSAAAPAVTGSLGLLEELHERVNGTNAPLFASTYKGLVIHTADEAGTAPGPDYRFGWGVMNTLSAAELVFENAQWNSNPFIKEVMLPDGEVICFPVEVGSNQTLRTTTCWSDPPGEGLINDLDLRIIGPSGQTNFPWVLNPTNGFRANPAATGENMVDNVEQVEITNTVAGTYTVLINHKGTLFEWVDEELIEGGQEVSIILSGILPEDIDPGLAFSVTTNGFPRLDITNAVGSVYEISRSTDLRFSYYWEDATNSPLSVIRPHVEWVDPVGSTNPSQFYRVKQTR